MSEATDTPSSASAQPKPRPLWRFLRAYARRYAWVYATGAAFLVLTNYINVLIPEYVQRAIDSVERMEPAENWLHYTAFIGGLAVSVIVTRTLSRVLFFNPGRTIEFRLKNAYFEHLMGVTPAFFRRFKTGELISRGTNDMMGVRSIIGFASLQLFNVVVSISLTVTKMVEIDAWLTLYCLLPFVFGVFVLRYGIRALIVQFRTAQHQVAQLSDTILETYAGAAVVQGFNAEPAFEKRFSKQNDDLIETIRKMALIRAFVLPIVVIIGSTCLVLLLLIGGQRVIDGALSLGQISAYASYIGIVVSALMSTGWVINSIQRGLVSLNRVYDVLDAELPHEPDPETGVIAAGRPPLLEVRGLTVDYPQEDAEPVRALSDVSFEVGAGRTLGIFGPTGSGKTTLVQALSRIHPPPEGTVFIDGRDLLDIPRQQLRGAMAVVPQEAYLFSRSLRENIGFADLPPDIDDDRVDKASHLASLASEIANMPEGLATKVGERGVTLSGGQRQRSALARAFYRDFTVLILDDVLSAVDHTTEQRLIESIRSRSTGQTTIVVSHRISALVHADEVLILEGGRVTARGRHDELLERGGIYAQTWAYQQQEGDEAPAQQAMAS